MLYARIGKTFSPISGNEVKKHRVSDVIDYIKTFDEGTKLLLLAPLKIDEKREPLKSLQLLSKQGYARIKHKGEVIRIDAAPTDVGREFDLVVDRVIAKNDEEFFNRLANAVDTAFFEGKGELIIEELSTQKQQHFSNNFELDGMSFLEPNVHLFSFGRIG